MPLETDNLPPNTPLGHYVILARLAKGGMGVVYKAFEVQLERYVAIKVLRPEYAKNATFVQHFQEEARSVAALSHPHIVPIHYIGEDNGCIYFSMGFIHGETFDHWLVKNRIFTEEEALWFMQQAISALDYAYKSNIVHLDIKPSNFLIDQENNIFLTDFGLAERLTRDRAEQQHKEAFGTPPYVSPEQIFRMKTDHRTDIYSLGATLYNLMVGEAPYVGETEEEILKGHAYADFPSAKAKAAGVPVAWIQLLKKMMEKNPDERFASYSELASALDAIRNLRGVHPVEHPASVILNTEVVNYQDLLAKDAKRAEHLVTRDLELMLGLDKKYHFTALTRFPSGLLLTFKKPEEALSWALDILEAFQEEPVTTRLYHRVGIHYGEFIVQGREVFGKCVTVAGKLQHKIGPNGVCISESLLNIITDKTPFEFKEFGTVVVGNGEYFKCYQVTRSNAPPKLEEEKPVYLNKLIIYSTLGMALAALLAMLIIYAITNHPATVISSSTDDSSGSIFDLFFPKK
jgi:serine/threonine protein kinase